MKSSVVLLAVVSGCAFVLCSWWVWSNCGGQWNQDGDAVAGRRMRLLSTPSFQVALKAAQSDPRVIDALEKPIDLDDAQPSSEEHRYADRTEVKWWFTVKGRVSKGLAKAVTEGSKNTWSLASMDITLADGTTIEHVHSPPAPPPPPPPPPSAQPQSVVTQPQPQPVLQPQPQAVVGQPQPQVGLGKPQPQAVVPQFQPPQPQPLPQLQPINSHFSIAFPSGGVLTSEMLIADRSSLASWLAAPREVAYLTRPDGSLYAICGNTNGVLNGQTITIYPNNALAMSATYANGVRQGVMKAWNDRGNGQYWCQYSKGKKHGFCCLFDDSLLQLVLQCDRGQTAAIHLISGTAISKSFTDEDDARTDESAAACLDRLKLTEDQLLKSEQRIRRQTQREDQKLRHTWAGGLNVAKRNDIINNANLHAAQTQAIINSLRAASW